MQKHTMTKLNFAPFGDVKKIRIPFKPDADWKQWMLNISDVHFDSKYCRRDLIEADFMRAKSRNAIVCDYGDWFDAMGGKYDPRNMKGDIREEYQVPDYFDAIVSDAAEFLKKYRAYIKHMSYGNHESSVLKRHETDILKNLTNRLKIQSPSTYGGFFILEFFNDEMGVTFQKVVRYIHGSGGSSPVTKGVIKTNRRQVSIQADIYISGHTHEAWFLPMPMTKVNPITGQIISDPQLHISLGTYKDDHMSGGWADSCEFTAPSLGGAWLKFYWDVKSNSIKVQAQSTTF